MGLDHLTTSEEFLSTPFTADKGHVGVQNSRQVLNSCSVSILDQIVCTLQYSVTTKSAKQLWQNSLCLRPLPILLL